MSDDEGAEELEEVTQELKAKEAKLSSKGMLRDAGTPSTWDSDQRANALQAASFRLC